MKNKKVLSGIDLFPDQVGKFRNKRLALVTNNAATTSNGESSRKALSKAGFNIIKLFSPEHGLAAKGEDGAFQKNCTDPVTQLPVTSLYAEKLKPDEKDLEDVDIVLFDIPDAGCRYYTYLWTMTYVMEACAACNKKFILLDRPNPTSGNTGAAEGPLLDEKNCSSFIGRWNIPVRHSCSLGELANYFSATRIKNLDHTIIKSQNWEREKITMEVSWNFIPPSPAITDIETALLYPGMGLLEGINVNEGRGTAIPFKVFGAPWIRSVQLEKEFNLLSIPGISCKPVTYKPESGLYKGEICNGLQFSVTNPLKFQPVFMGLQLIRLLLLLNPLQCSERFYKTNVNPTGKYHLDKLTGVPETLDKLKKGEILSTVLKDSEWKTIIEPYLLY